MPKRTYHVHPATTAELAIARTAVLKTKRLIIGHQGAMRNDGNAIGDLRILDPLDICLHQCAANLLALMLWQHGERVDGNRAAVLVMTNSLSILHSHALFLPLRRELHRLIRHHRVRGSRGDDMAHQRRARLRLALPEDWKSKQAET